MTRADQITAVLQQRDGLSDGQLSERIFGSTHRSTQINGECTYLQNKGVVARKRLGDGPILNFLVRAKPTLRLVMQDDPGVSHNEFGATQEEPTKETTFLNETSCATPSDEVFCKTHQQPKSALESDFEHAMYQIYRLADEECDYRPTYFLRMLAENGGVRTAKILLSKSTVSGGFTKLATLRRLDLSVEALVLQPKWKSLFTEAEISVARRRLS